MAGGVTAGLIVRMLAAVRVPAMSVPAAEMLAALRVPAMRVLAMGVLAAVGVLGCSDDGGQAAGAATASPYKEIDPVGSAKRPERRYYVHNTNGNCVVYWIAPKARSIRRKVRCPREVLPSERLRLSGRVCFRESESVERRGAVRCPPSILRPERDDRADAGEYRLPAQKKP